MTFQTRFVLLLLLSLSLASAAPLVADEVPAFDVNLSTSIVSLPFKIVDAEYSSSLNAIVAVSASPNQLHIYKIDASELVSVNLEVPPTCVSVSPDGHSAVVGHNAWISHVNLDTATLLQTISVSAVISDIVLGGNGYAYAFAQGSFVPIYSINLTTGVQSQSAGSIFGNTVARLHPAGLAMYGADTSVSPADIRKFHINNGPAVIGNDSPYHGDYSMCGNLWFSVDGQRIYTACSNVFRSSTDTSQDMRYVGSFSQPVFIEWAAHTELGSNIAVLPAQSASSGTSGEINYYTPDFLLYRGKAVLPRFVVGQDTFAARGRWVFFNAAGTKQYVVVQAETAAGLTNDFGLVTVDCTNASVVLNPTSASFSAAFATSQFSVTGTAGCGWKSISNDPWINTNSSGVGDGTVTYTVSANTTVAPRNGSITIGGVTFPISQAGATPTAVVATAITANTVSLTWSSAVAADHFEVWRNAGAGFVLVGSPATTAFNDTTTASSAYVYKVRAVATGGAMSEFSAPDYAHTFTLTDPIVGVGTLIRAAHVTELRTVVNAIRAAAGLAPSTFTDSSLAAAVPKRVHITDLRDAINATRTSLAMAPVVFSTLPFNDVIRASTTEEVRAAVR